MRESAAGPMAGSMADSVADSMTASAAPETGALLDVADIFEALPDAWLILDAEATVVAANRAYLALVACEREAIVGRSIY
ncbi:MAG: PAS domain-containing protein, partial [Paraburkholderia tropica]